MLEAVIQSKARIELLRLLLLDSESRFYLRELVAKTGLPQGSVQRELANLLKAEILVRETSGRQTYYHINEHCPIIPELRSMFVKTVGVADVIRKALEPESEAILAAFIYGSFARGEVRAESDIDLLIVGDITLRRLTVLLKDVNISRIINPTVMSKEEFSSRLVEDDHFIGALMKLPKLFLIGDENEF